MAGREPVGIPSARPGLAASAAVALAYGVVLPVLPTVVASSPSPARAIAELMAVYSAAMVVTAPIWVRVCRQLPAHLLVRLSLLGQAAAMIMLLWSSETTMLLLARGLQGIFAGAALPALQTAASRAAGSEGDRSQRLSDLTRAALVGGLLGPGVGAVAAPDDSLVGPVLVGVAVLVLAAAAQRPATGSSTIVVAGPGSPRDRDVVVLILLAALAAAAMSVYEVGLATQGRLVDGLSARALGFMFTGCGVVMLLSQSLVFRPRHDPLRAFAWVAPSFVATAAGLALLAWLGGRWPSALGLILVAAGGGVLQPALVYWTSRAAGPAEATGLGWRASFTSAGQALGSLAGGFAFAATLVGKIALATLLLTLLVAAMLALARRRAPAGLPYSVPTHER
ncbi:MFS transporter [Thermomonas fusca]|uniref:MFS transporter n=1 Tax=Thermomonas fusca TaxID=215690 RepID=UPI000410FAA8|nr:MFS transporter [Thermomonas fusca]